MKGTALYRRTVASICLVITAVLSVVWVMLQPPFDGSMLDRLTAVGDAGDAAVISVLAFAVSQLPFIIGMLSVAHLVAHRAPKLAAIGGTLAVLGGFGHAVFAGLQLSQVMMAADTANHDVYAALLETAPPAGVAILMMVGTAGTVLGLLFLGIALFRSRAVSRWVPITLWAFILVEFVGGNFFEWASLASGVLYLGALGALAVAVWRSPLTVWMSAGVVEPSRRARELVG
jgi:hypothetical protein